MGRYFAFVFLLISLVAAAQGKPQKIAVHFSNPAGLISKARMKFEYRFRPGHSILVTAAGYYAFCPGSQETIEYRHYFPKTTRKEVPFFYAKAGIGHGVFVNFDTWYPNTGPGTYFLAGGGIGQHLLIGKKKHFFIDIAEGLKICPVERTPVKERYGVFFYITGPGSVIDLNAHFGWSF